MINLTEKEISDLANLVATFEHPGSPTFREEFREEVRKITQLSENKIDYLFEHMLSIDPMTRVALHFDHRKFILNTIDSYEKNKIKNNDTYSEQDAH